MKIPALNERASFYKRIIRACMLSQNDRMQDYNRLRNYYLFGTSNGEKIAFNRIQSHVDLVSSFLFAQDTTRFSIQLGDEATEEDKKRDMNFARKINREWEDSNGDITLGQAVTWALVYNSTLIKLTWQKGAGIVPYFLEPHMFGVYREDISQLDRQEAMVHEFYVTKSELSWMLRAHPNVDAILARVEEKGDKDEQPMNPVTRMMISQSNPNLMGADPVTPWTNRYSPQVAEPLVKLSELWIRDDDLGDYRTVTFADPDVVIYDRPNIFLPNENPFTFITPNPLYDYIWGKSEVSELTNLQDWRNKRMSQVDEMLEKQVRPPKLAYGISGVLEERVAALQRAGGFAQANMPNGFVKDLTINIPNNVFGEVQAIDEMFSEIGGTNSTLQGKGESGVRSTGHAAQVARLSSTRIRKRALIIEDALERLATQYGKLIQAHSTSKLKSDDGIVFLPAQFTNDYVVKVDAHSSSPIFVEDLKQLGAELLEAKVIDRETLIEMLNLPMKDVLLERLKTIQKNEAAQQQQLLALEQESIQSGKTPKKLTLLGKNPLT